MHTTLKNVALLKHFKNKGGHSNMFWFTRKPSSGSHSQYSAKITHCTAHTPHRSYYAAI